MTRKRVFVLLLVAVTLLNSSSGLTSSGTMPAPAAQPFPRGGFFDCFVQLVFCSIGGFRDVVAHLSGAIRIAVTPQGTFEFTEGNLFGTLSTPMGDFGCQIRESPTQRSTGTITPMPEGFGYQIDSFFDVFVELDPGGGAFRQLTTDKPLSLSARFNEFCGARFTPPPPPCEPRLLDPQGQVVGSISRIEIAICQPLAFSVAKGGPSMLDPADIYIPGPLLLRSRASLGLLPGDDIDALSAAADFLISRFQIFPRFGVDPASRGVFGSAVRTESTKSPAEAHGDEFGLPGFGPGSTPCVGSGANLQCYDENGMPAVVPGLGLRICDDVDAIDEVLPLAADSPVYFSLTPGSPTLAALGADPADILVSVGGLVSVYVAAARLGLRRGDDVDALCLKENSDGVYTSGRDEIRISLAPDSPTLATIGASPADVLRPGTPPTVAIQETDMGLTSRDNLNALKCRALP
jgi:hypothetical protein